MSAPDALTEVQPEDEVWGLGRRAAYCGGCGRTWLVPSGTSGRCVCGQDMLEPSHARVPREPPEAIVPPRLDRSRLAEHFHERIRSAWLLDRSQSAEELARNAVLCWWPRWQVDATVVGQWSAEVGYDYQARSTVERFAGGSWHTEERVEARIRWEPRVGQVVRRLHDVPVPALQDEAAWRQRLGPMRLDSGEGVAQAFAAGILEDGWIELPDLAPGEVWHRAEPGFREWIGQVVGTAADGQHVRDVHLDATYPDPTWTIALRPVWWVSYPGDQGEIRAVAVDAVTGWQHGYLKASMARAMLWAGVFGAIAVVLWFLAIVCVLVGIIVLPLAIVGMVIGVFALVATPLPLVPIVTVWRWNRKVEG
mgnify:CR=1 FL=1